MKFLRASRPAATAVLAALIAAGCAAGAVVSPATTPNSAPASASQAPLAATPSATASSSPSPSTTSALPEGTYRTDPVPVSTIVAALKAENVPTAQYEADMRGVETVVFTLRFQDGRMVWFASIDGGPDDINAEGTYVIEDGRTIVETDASGDPTSIIRIDFTLDGPTLTTHWQPDAIARAWDDPAALPGTTSFFNSAPYTRQP